MSSLKGFSKRIRLRGKAVELNAEKLIRKIALAVDQTVVMETPVDTGRARLNWQVTLDSPAVGTLAEPSSPGAGEAAALAQGRAVAAAYKRGQAIYIVNNLDYIGRLNDGWSAQAPAGYVEAAVMVAINAVIDREPLVGRS